MFNKKEIMTQAWNWFNDEDVWMSDIEWSAYNENEKTFANCLKASWRKAKEQVEEQKELTASIAKSEELRAWNWAEKKLNVKTDLTDKQKFNNVCGMKKEDFYASVYQCAMRALKLELKHAA